MKNKFTIIALSISLLASWTALAQEEHKGENFAKHKAKIIADLNKEKAMIDQSIACINSAQKREDAEKCREQRQATMEKMRQERISQRKEHLQGELKKLDEESKNAPNKGEKRGEYKRAGSTNTNNNKAAE